jgi:simple sugar transport system permease protein
MIRMRLERRDSTPAWLNLALPVLAVLATLVLCSGLVAMAGANVWTAYSKLFLSALDSRSHIVETFVKAAPLIFTGLAVAVAFRAKFWNCRPGAWRR